MREIRSYGSEGGGTTSSPYPYPPCLQRELFCCGQPIPQIRSAIQFS